MAIKRAPVSWVMPTPYGMIHVVTDADPSIIYWVSSTRIENYGATLSNSVRNGLTAAEGSAGDGKKAPPGERSFAKWWNYVWFTPYRYVFGIYGPGGPVAFRRSANVDHRYITIISLPNDPADHTVDLLSQNLVCALGIQGTEGESVLNDVLLEELFKNFKDPFRDPAFN